MVNITSIQEIQDKVVWRSSEENEYLLEYLCIKCRTVVYTVNAIRQTSLYKEELIDIVKTHKLNCLGAQSEIKFPTIRMIRV